MTSFITIGRLARRVGMRSSTLRYYEAEGLLTPSAHSEAGYRLYDVAAEQTLRFIQRAQRLGFSLADIRQLLTQRDTGRPSDDALTQIAEARYLALEQQLTALHVQQRELELFVRDLRTPQINSPGDSPLDRFLDRVCTNTLHRPAAATLEWLLSMIGCTLASTHGRAIIDRLRGIHTHIWQVDDAYHMLVIDAHPAARMALDDLAQLETGCAAHMTTHPRLTTHPHPEGTLLIARGDQAFLYARLFLALDEESSHTA
jgi:DNA-binding transcriptional MerR regulator